MENYYMENYYKEWIKILAEQIDLAQRGLVVKLQQKGIEMSNTHDYEAMRAKIKQASESVNAVEDLEWRLEFAKKEEYTEKCEKLNRSKAVETLYGGKNNG